MQPDYSFQKDTIAKVYDSIKNQLDGIDNNQITLLGAAIRSGKTNMSINVIDKIVKEYPKTKVLVLAHGQTVLRSQFFKRLESLNSDFNFIELESGKRLTKKVVSDNSVFVTLPQYLTNSKLETLSKYNFDLVVVDEAHQFLYAKMVQNILNKLNPKSILAMTGTPSKILKKEQETNSNYTKIFVSPEDLLKRNIYNNCTLKLCHSTVGVSASNYNKKYNVKTDFILDKKEIENTLENVLMDIYNAICSNNKHSKKLASFTDKLLPSFLKNLGKTMFLCRNQKEAIQVFEFFNNKNIPTLVSTSDSDSESENIETFKKNKKFKILVVVDRATLGFDFPELENMVDFKMSLNPDVILQAMGRLFTKHPEDKNKLYFRVVNVEQAVLDLSIMNFVVAMLGKDVYTTYTGNYRNKKVPIKLIKKHIVNNSKKLKELNKSIKDRCLKKLDLPEYSIFENVHYTNKNLTMFAYLSISSIKENVGLLKIKKWNLDSVKKEALKYSKWTDFLRKSGGAYSWALRNKKLDEVCKHLEKRKKWDLDSVKKFAKSYKNATEFMRSPAYMWALRNKKLDEVYRYLKNKRKKWDLNSVKKEALRYKLKTDFQRKSAGAYNWALNNKKLDEVCTHMNILKRWNLDSVKKEALKYKTKNDFRKKSAGAYNWARRNKKIDGVCAHMLKLTKKK